MPDNVKQAIEKIKAEMEKEKNSYVQVVGQFLLQHLESNPEDAVKVLTEDKSIMKSLQAMRKEAEKKKFDNFAMLTPQEGFQFILAYYGIEGDVATVPAPTAVPSTPAKPTNDEFNVSLDDLLG
ncbi:hypothetical protein [Schinkia azotoformans]|uniref:hypothetical protein n=1 Tax=Schinkia azotoformans TaxID=1454 RepID=UPI002DBA6241|nr:hypothetical protein [Schinkia azotoformans]MEC1716635.1 hypothetical protein [Schinkia azotoformans]MEC1739474.1 hypothetical protein [Schinkia azotoformans]MEC1745456.1 hypothetical protein [Schinkia azotoformans]MEC1756519.1 hypothetical protein [Schinkia azotoformans]MEC1765786.1 hypothetical protein [Schinkia azotoformans]